MSGSSESPRPEKKSNLLFRVGTWLIAIGCFYLVYRKIEQAAFREDLGVLDYLLRFFGEADWVAWLALMIPYSLFFFVVDAHVTWRVIRWFNAPQIKLFNALIGVVFLPKANKELFGRNEPGPGTVEHGNDGGGDQQPGEPIDPAVVGPG